MRKSGLTFLFVLLLIVSVQAMSNPEQKVSAAIKKYVVSKYPAWSQDEIKLDYKYTDFSKFERWPETAGIKVVEVYPEFKPIGNVVFPLLIGDEKIYVRAKVGVIKSIMAANRLIKRGKIIEADDLKADQRDIAILPEKYFTDNGGLIGKAAKLTIPANSSLFAWMVGDPPLIQRGSEVTILVVGNGLAIRAKGQAQQEGYLNGEIKVKRNDSKKILVGKVKSANEVEVNIE